MTRQTTHPAVRLLLLALAAGFLATGRGPVLILAGSAVLALLLATGFRDWPSLARGLARLRWFYLSIAVLYLWFTPGLPLLPALGGWSPSVEGLRQGAARVAVLVVLLSAVRLLFHCSHRAELVAAVAWWSRPLSRLGVEPATLGLRMVLCLETLPRLQRLARRCWRVGRGRPALQRIPGVGAVLLAVTLRQAERAPCPRVSVPRLPRPGPRDWLLAAVTATLLAAAASVPAGP